MLSLELVSIETTYARCRPASSGAAGEEPRKGSPYRLRAVIGSRVTRFDSTDRAFAIALAALAGYIDAIGFLATGGFFVSFMSGNTTRLGVGLASMSSDAGIAGRLIVMFVGGVTIGTLLARGAGAWRRPVMLVAIAAMISICVVVEGGTRPGLAVALIAMTMGMQNTVLSGDDEVRVGITYMTGTLVKIGRGLATAIAGGAAWDWVPYLMLWTGLMSGAWIGATVFFRYGLSGLWAAALGALLLAVVSLGARVRAG